MKRKIIKTSDGSTTIQLEEWNEQYHSKHGAIQEAYHVFLQNGFFALDKKKISILEMGFGTGLNTLITYLEAHRSRIKVDYLGIEAFPVSNEELGQMNYVEELGKDELAIFFDRMHKVSWEEYHQIGPYFKLCKQKKTFFQIDNKAEFDLVYFDAFGPRVQPELWTVEIFAKMYSALKPGGVLVTYSAKGSVRRALQEVGFIVERLPGPPGKREMLRAQKPSGMATANS